MRAVLSLCFVLAATVAATAQTPEVEAELRKLLGAPRDAERNEDIEVLRRILNRGLGLPDKVTIVWPLGESTAILNPLTTLGNPTGGLGHYTPPMFPATRQVSSPIGPFDGVYLPGHGVVFTLRVPETLTLALQPPAKSSSLPETCLKCHATEPVSRTALQPDPDAAKRPPEEWERVQQELRGESVAQAPQVVARLAPDQICNHGAVANQLLVKLHANAGRVRHLLPEESITVVITFDGLTGSARNRVTLNPGSDGPSGGGSGPLAPLGRVGFTPEEIRHLTLGDLHLKQGKAQQAIDAYQQALVRYRPSASPFRADPPENLTPEKARLLLQELRGGVRDVYAKLAQAHLVAGEVAAAETALAVARKFEVELVPAPAKRGGVPFPAKLMVSLKLAEFRKAEGDPAAVRKVARVETVGFPAADRTAKK